MRSVFHLLKSRLTGLTIPQEYICLHGRLTKPLRVFLTWKGVEAVVDVTHIHTMLGYKPLVIGIMAEKGTTEWEQLRTYDSIALSFQGNVPEVNFRWRGFPSDRHSLARLELKKINADNRDATNIFMFEAIFGQHHFIHWFHRIVTDLRQLWTKRKPGNVGLPGNLYDQVRIAYAVPRSVQVITVSDGAKVNIFPTDLHGVAGTDEYCCSLRAGGKATSQVEEYKRIVLSEVKATSFSEVYSLGPNHMQELREERHFEIDERRSATFKFPLPASVIRYRELRHIRFIEAGIHRIHFFKIVHSEDIELESNGVYHIHQFYAQWRLNHGMETAMLMRT